MKYLLDTGPFSAWLRGRNGARQLLGQMIEQGEAVTSILVYGEVMEYFLRFPHYAQLQADTRGFLAKQVKPLSVTYAIGERYATIRRSMRLQGGLIGDIDTCIAATALVNDLTVVTIDSDFTRVPGLSVQLLSKAEIK